ncbi:hypothetical protein BH24GEM2_BH24GEM2_11580 [soil metagenome]
MTVLDLSGAVVVTVEGIPMRVDAMGRELRVTADRPVALLRRGGLRVLKAAAPTLERLGLTVRVGYQGRVVASAGYGVARGWRRWVSGGKGGNNAASGLGRGR